MTKLPGYFIPLLLFVYSGMAAQTMTGVAEGWASNSVNTVVFRKNSLTSLNGWQFISFYDEHQNVVIGKRKIGSASWQIKQTQFKGDCKDAHKSISIMLDGDGYLHLAWDQHNNKLNYAKSKEPFSTDFTQKLSMTGKNEQSVTYPEFYRLANGDLIFMYRDGGSGRGNLVLNRYDLRSKKWAQVQENLIDGEGKRNAYWQAFVDPKGTIHVSWVWRESPDVASNHDMCYARSKDGGITWERSTGEKYTLPINAVTAEYAFKIPQKSELINQTSMYADKRGHPYIATYWRDQQSAIPQYRLIFKKGKSWQSQNPGFRAAPFSLSGGGTKRIPISRPQIIAWKKWFGNAVVFIFRDEERGGKPSLAINKNLKKSKWIIKDLSGDDLGSWEPGFDTNLWVDKKILNLFIQKTEQADNEGASALKPQMIKVLQWKP